jgi:glycosyltransferase involved in cell wall biosynthesis
MDPLLSIIIPARNDAQALRLTLDHLEHLRAIETAEIIGAASGDTEAIAVTHNADKAAVSFSTFHCRFNFVF